MTLEQGQSEEHRPEQITLRGPSQLSHSSLMLSLCFLLKESINVSASTDWLQITLMRSLVGLGLR